MDTVSMFRVAVPDQITYSKEDDKATDLDLNRVSDPSLVGPYVSHIYSVSDGYTVAPFGPFQGPLSDPERCIVGHQSLLGQVGHLLPAFYPDQRFPAVRPL